MEKTFRHVDLVGFLISLIQNNKALGLLFRPLSLYGNKIFKKGPFKYSAIHKIEPAREIKGKIKCFCIDKRE